MTPTQRSLAHLRAAGYLCAVVERFNAFSKTRLDLWGFVDVLAIRPGEVLAVQVTSGSNVAARVNKITEHENLPHVRAAGIGVHVHGWRKGANGRYALRVVDLS